VGRVNRFDLLTGASKGTLSLRRLGLRSSMMMGRVWFRPV